MIKYFDYAATTQMSEKAFEIYSQIEQKYFANSQNDFEAEKLLEESKESILKILNLDSSYEVIYTSGGTESNNLGIFGKFKNSISKKHFITSTIEHPSVLATFKELERLGHTVTYLTPTNGTKINIKEIKDSLQKNTALISIMATNNELGTTLNTEEIFSTINQSNPNIITFSDSISAIGKINFSLKNIDMFTISGHKFEGPKGIGVLIKKKNIVLSPILFGSETSLRPGTQSLGTQIAFVYSLKQSILNLEKNNKTVNDLRTYLIEQLSKNPQINFNIPTNLFTTNVISCNLKTKALAETLISTLREKGFILSTKSSCSTKLNKPSHVLQTLDITTHEINRTLRISISHKTTKIEIDQLCAELVNITETF